MQEGFTGFPLDVAATISLNSADDGTAAGQWLDRATVSGPLTDGSNGVLQLGVADLEGRHLVRVTIPGATGSPMIIGPLLLDRIPPAVIDATVTMAGDRVDVGFTLDDAGRSGVDPNVATLVEYQAPDGWHLAGTQPTPDAGRKAATIDSAQLAEGVYPVRVIAADRAGNAGITQLGSFTVDRTPPIITPLAITTAPTQQVPSVRLAFTAADSGSGLDPANPPVAVNADTGAVMAQGVAGETSILVPLPGAGTYRIAVQVTDRAGRITRSAAVSVTDPRQPIGPLPIGAPGTSSTTTPLIAVRRAAPLTAGERWAWVQIQRLHRARGVALSATLYTARTPAQWGQTIGTPIATRVDAYTTLTGTVAIGPTASRALNRLATLRGCPRCRLSSAQARTLVDGLAVTLHESLHATGPTAPADQATPEGRAFEEAFTEAATVDLLPRLIRSLNLPSTTRTALLRQASRYRPHYPAELAWARQMSTLATRAPATSAAAVRWRVRVADTWGADRWTLLAAATGRAEADLRASAPPVARP